MDRNTSILIGDYFDNFINQQDEVIEIIRILHQSMDIEKRLNE